MKDLGFRVQTPERGEVTDTETTPDQESESCFTTPSTRKVDYHLENTPKVELLLSGIIGFWYHETLIAAKRCV